MAYCRDGGSECIEHVSAEIDPNDETRVLVKAKLKTSCAPGEYNVLVSADVRNQLNQTIKQDCGSQPHDFTTAGQTEDITVTFDDPVEGIIATTYEDPTDPGELVTIELRLPRRLVERLRAKATERTKGDLSELIARLLEERLD